MSQLRLLHVLSQASSELLMSSRIRAPRFVFWQLLSISHDHNTRTTRLWLCDVD